MSKTTDSRREFIKNTSLAAFGLLLANSCATKSDNPTILVLSGWQDMNIGDIAHTPGLLHMLEVFLPNHKLILWKRTKGEEADDMLRSQYPHIPIIYGNVDGEKNVDSLEVREAFDKADLLLHGSGPTVRQEHLEAWIKHSDKPFGILGVTIERMKKGLKEVLKKASFVYTRETDSLRIIQNEGIDGQYVDFAPDATFFMDIRDDARADTFLKTHGLETKKFMCAIPRLRYSPSYKFKKNLKWSKERIQMVEEVNAATKEIDHAKLREVIIAWVRNTKNKVLVCPEMTYQIDIMDELLIDPLPDDIKPYIIKRGYWMPDEAASVYARAHSIVSFECHSPIMGIFNQTPSFYLRQPTDTIKGQMYYDVKLDDWVFEIDDTDSQQIIDRLLEIHQNYKKAQTKITSVNNEIKNIYSQTSKVISKTIG